MEKNEEYIKQLESQKEISLNEFLKGFEVLKDYRERENYLKIFFCKEINNILNDEEFIKGYYVDTQAKYFKDKLNSELDLKQLSTLIYCYNTNLRDFKKKKEENELKEKLEKEGFKEINPLDIESLRKLHRKKVICVLDVNRLGILGSFTEKDKIEGKLIYNETNQNIYLMPKRHTKTGLLIYLKAYYKEKDD